MRVPGSAGFHLNGQQAVAGFDHEVHLAIRCGAPVEHFRLGNLALSPHQQVHEHQIFQVGAGQLGAATQPERERRVGPVELGSLD